MKNWEKFELQASKYLSSLLNQRNIKVLKTGGSDSTSNDIIILSKDDILFSVEAKLSPSQCGQFVLLNSDEQGFVLSNKMVYENEFTLEIIKNIKQYNLDSNSLIRLEVEQSLLANWIKYHYLNKGVRFLITSTQLNSFHAIVPVEKIQDYFDFSCVLRKKRSGTRGVPKRDRKIVLNLLNEHLKKQSLKNLSILNEDSGIYIVNPSKKGLFNSNDLYFDKYFISVSDPNKYEVKVRATTNNPNVIFSLSYKGPFQNTGETQLLEFVNEITNQL